MLSVTVECLHEDETSYRRKVTVECVLVFILTASYRVERRLRVICNPISAIFSRYHLGGRTPRLQRVFGDQPEWVKGQGQGKEI